MFANFEKFLKSKLYFVIIGPAYVIMLLLTMWKDLHFTHNTPNILFYFTVPIVSIIVSSIISYILFKFFKKVSGFFELLGIFLLIELLGQIWENLAKIIYYTVWQYPGILWFIYFPFSFVLTSYLLKKVSKSNWIISTVVMILSMIISTAAAMYFSTVTGIETPGS